MPKVNSPLFADPIYNGAADPMIIKNEQNGKYYMFYTQRRASCTFPNSVAYCYGSKIGVAEAEDNGAYWHYLGALDLEFEFGTNTFWAPEIIWDNGTQLYHMYVSYIKGIHSQWRGEANILHYISDDLFHWDLAGKLELDSNKIIDPCIFKINDTTYRMWYKCEQDKAYICYADSTDLYKWEYKGYATTDCSKEGPNVFEFGGAYWLIADEWNGLSVYRSDDLTNFVRQDGERLLTGNGTRNFDKGVGRHADVLIHNDKAYIVYFVHYNDDENQESESNHEPSVVQLAELEIKNGILCCDRNKEIEIDLT